MSCRPRALPFRARIAGIVLALVCALAGPAPLRANDGAAPLTHSFDNVSLPAILVTLAKHYKTTIVYGPDVRGFVSVALHHASFAQALAAVLAPGGYVVERRNGSYFVRADKRTPPAANSGASPTVLPVTVIPVDEAVHVLRGLYPQASIRANGASNALVVTASTDDLQAMRSILQGIDVKNPTAPLVDAITLRDPIAGRVAARLRPLYPHATFVQASSKTLLIRASPTDVTQIKSVVGALDAPSATPSPGSTASEAVRVTQRSPRDVARSLSRQISQLHVAVSGGAVVLSGPPDVVARGKALLVQIDVPQFGARYTELYRLRSVDASSVAALLKNSFPNGGFSVNVDLNAISVTGSVTEHRRIADAIAQLDSPPAAPSAGGSPGPAYGPGGSVEIVSLRSAVPGGGQGGPDSTTALIQATQAAVPDAKIIPLSTAGTIAITGNAESVRIAKDFLAKIDVAAPLVVLDTELLELDETIARNLGIELSQPVLSTTFSELQPVDTSGLTTTARLIGLQPLTRTPLSLGVQLNLLIQRGTARVLADPRLTTLSGRTATIRAGDTIGILTTIGGGVGTPATTQLQTFQTGVTLDITPIVANDQITVSLHPVVNSLSGILNGVPQISTRDAQTTVTLRDNQTLIIGGLIQENANQTETKLPILGDLPAIGHLFRNQGVNSTRNELVVVVTPHILNASSTPPPLPTLPTPPTPRVLPTLPPTAVVPPPHAASTIVKTTNIPVVAHTSLSLRTAAPTVGTSVSSPSLATSPSPGASGSPGAAPQPTPTAFGATNTFVFGQAPQNNFAGPTDAVQIFYAQLAPTVIVPGSSVVVSAITTTNVQRLALQAGSTSTQLTSSGQGKWQGTIPIPAAALSGGQNPIQFVLVAARGDGASASVSIPVSVATARPNS